MKKIIALSEAIVISIVSFLINALIFISFYYSLKNAEYKSLAFSIYIIFISLAAILAFVLLVTIKALKENILYLIFGFFFFLGLSVFILMVIWHFDSSSVYWILSVLNLSFTTCTGILIYQKLKSEDSAKVKD